MPKAAPLAETPIFQQVIDEFSARDVSIYQIMNRKPWTPDPVNKEFYSRLDRMPMNAPDGRTLAPIVCDAEAAVHLETRRKRGPGISKRQPTLFGEL